MSQEYYILNLLNIEDKNIKIVKLIHKNSRRKKVFKMNRMYPINYDIQTSVWGGAV